MKVVLDTSVLIADDAPGDVEAAISVASITELHFGLLVAADPDERARRAYRLAAVEAAFDPVPVTVDIARVWGRLAAAVVERGGQPRRRQMDLLIAATAITERATLLSHNTADFAILGDLVDVRQP
jgi:toxin FitB